jgi:hypothetical protein
MTEQEPQLPEKLRKALRASPTLTPPESFYQAVLRKIGSADRRIGEPAKDHDSASRRPSWWGWGVPAKAFAAACVVMVMVLVTRETRKSQPRLFSAVSQKADKRSETEARVPSIPTRAARLDERQAPEEPRQAPLKDLAQTKEVEDRLHRDISSLVGMPSPFEGVEENAPAGASQASVPTPAASLGSRTVDEAKPSSPARKMEEGRGIMLQARDTVSGIASQHSFGESLSVGGALIAKKAVPMRAVNAEVGLAQSQVPPSEIWQGSNSGVHEFRTVTATNSRDWQVLWDEHTRSPVSPSPRSPVSSSPAPPIDFSREMVVGVFLGDRPNPGYRVEIAALKTLPDQLVVEYHETLPDPIGRYPQVIAQPFILKVIPKTHLPVHFQYLHPQSPQ